MEKKHHYLDWAMACSSFCLSLPEGTPWISGRPHVDRPFEILRVSWGPQASYEWCVALHQDPYTLIPPPQMLSKRYKVWIWLYLVGGLEHCPFCFIYFFIFFPYFRGLHQDNFSRDPGPQQIYLPGPRTVRRFPPDQIPIWCHRRPWARLESKLQMEENWRLNSCGSK